MSAQKNDIYNSTRAQLVVFQRKVLLRRIFGLVQDHQTQEFKIMKYIKLDMTYNKPNIVTNI